MEKMKTTIEFVKPAYKNSIHTGYVISYDNGAPVCKSDNKVIFFKTKFDAAIYRALNGLH
jgi:hypothetical protein